MQPREDQLQDLLQHLRDNRGVVCRTSPEDSVDEDATKPDDSASTRSGGGGGGGGTDPVRTSGGGGDSAPPVQTPMDPDASPLPPLTPEAVQLRVDFL